MAFVGVAVAWVSGAAHVYPAAEGKTDGAGYSARVDGQAAPVLELRHSAMPVNIRWPGHQREKDQTELTGLVRFSFQGSAKVEITAPRDFRTVKIRPQSKGVRPRKEGRTVSFEIREPGGYSVEFDGIHEGALVFADPPETLRVKAGEKNVRYFGPGVHEVGAIEMADGETLYIDEGAVVFGYIHAKDADNIRILGRGILDMSRIHAEILKIDPEEEKELRSKGFALTNEIRHDAVLLEFCDNVLIDGITVKDSLAYNIRPVCCRNLTIRNVKLCGNWRYNSDGIDMHNCENVRISDCFIRTFDDSICVKGFDYRMDMGEMMHDGYLHDVFTNAVIERCTVWCDWGRALEFGAETRARKIADVTFRNCDVIRADAVVCDIQNCDSADIHDVLFEDIRVEFDSPFYNRVYQESISNPKYERKEVPSGQPTLFAAAIKVVPEYSKGDKRRGRIHGITLRNAKVVGSRQVPKVELDGFDAEHRTTDVTIDGVYSDGREVSSDVSEAQHVGQFAESARFPRLHGGESDVR